jgi:hypothetical protein
MAALKNSSGKVVGACDSGLPFDIHGRRPFRPRARPASRAQSAADTTVEATWPKMQDVLKGYARLK